MSTRVRKRVSRHVSGHDNTRVIRGVATSIVILATTTRVYGRDDGGGKLRHGETWCEQYCTSNMKTS